MIYNDVVCIRELAGNRHHVGRESAKKEEKDLINGENQLRSFGGCKPYMRSHL